MIKSRIFHFLVLVFISFASRGQQVLSITGKITDSKSNPVSSASVYLLNTHYKVFCDSQGNFEFHDLREGDYTIAISAIGYAALTKPLHLSKKANASLYFQLADAAVELDNVYVTAEKKEENVQHAPLSISVLTSKNIDEYRLWNSKDFTSIVPNLYAGNPGDGRNVISIRGITSSSYDPAVTTYVDGVSQFTLKSYMPLLFDIERIEVLKGPQGTLYGRNAMGGVINIITRQPTNKTEGFVETSIGNFGEQRYCAAIRTPLKKDKLFFGASVLYEGLDGYYFNKYTQSKFDKQHSVAGNYYFKYIVNPKWIITLNFKHLFNRNYGSFPLAGNINAAFANPFQVNQNAVAKSVDNTFNTSLSVSYTGVHFNLSAQTALQTNYRYYDTPIDGDFSPIDGVTIINNYGKEWNNVKVVTQEVKFSSPASSMAALKWTTGAYLFYQDVPGKQATHFGKDARFVGSPSDSNYAIIGTTKAKSTGAAVFAQLVFSVNKRTDIIGGIRYDYQYSEQSVLAQYQKDQSPGTYVTIQPDTSGHASFSALSPMLSVAYHPQSNVNLYVTYSRGYRTGGLTQLALDRSQVPLYSYQPEYSNNFEIGIKNTLLKNRLKVSLAVFYTTITNAQVPTLILPSAITVTKNAGSLDSRGLDAEILSVPAKNLEATYNFGYTKATYNTLKLSQNGREADLGGKRQIFTPEITSMLAIQYGIVVNKSKSVKVIMRGEWSYLGEEFFNLKNTIRQSPYSLFNARVGFKARHFDLFCWGRNLGDKKYVDYAYDFGAVHLGNPETYGITVKINF